MWILCLAEDPVETLSLIFSEKQWKNSYECRLLQSWLALTSQAIYHPNKNTQDRPPDNIKLYEKD